MKVVVRESKIEGIGLSPGQVVRTLEGGQGPVRLRFIGYGPDGYFERDDVQLGDIGELLGQKGVGWVQVYGIHDSAMIQELGRLLNIHPLALEDVLSTWGRSKLQDYGEQLFVVGKAAVVESSGANLFIEQVAMVVGRNYLVSFQESDRRLFRPVEERIRDPQRIIRRKNSGYLLYALLDTLVDHLLATLDVVEEDILEMEEEILEDEEVLDTDEIYRRKRAILMLSRMAFPMQELGKRLEMLDNEIVPDSLDYFFRDLADHSTRATERVVNARAVLQNLQEYYLLRQGHRTNEVMRTLTVVSTLFIPLTFIAGVYGMNFSPDAGVFSMPELREAWGYPVTLGGMAVYMAVMLLYFKKKGWF